MQINKHNYEAWFLDFWENALDVDAREMLSGFLEAHPDLQDEFLDFREAPSVKLSPDQDIEFAGKQELKKPDIISTENINHGNYEDYIIAKIEDDLNDHEIDELERFRNVNPQLAHEFELFNKTILQPDNSIAFKDKQSLKRQSASPVIFRTFIYATAVAAILVIAFIIVNPFTDREKIPGMARLEAVHNLPVKPLPKIFPESADLSASGSGTIAKADMPEPEVSKADLKEILAASAKDEMVKNNTDISNSDRPDFNITRISRNPETPTLASLPVVKQQIAPRTEMTGVFEYLQLRDELRAQNHKKDDRGAFGRILANIGNQLFGAGDEESNSLIGQIAETGRERISELKDDAPSFETVEDENSKKTYFAINENWRIRISKSINKDEQLNAD